MVSLRLYDLEEVDLLAHLLTQHKARLLHQVEDFKEAARTAPTDREACVFDDMKFRRLHEMERANLILDRLKEFIDAQG